MAFVAVAEGFSPPGRSVDAPRICLASEDAGYINEASPPQAEHLTKQYAAPAHPFTRSPAHPLTAHPLLQLNILDQRQELVA